MLVVRDDRCWQVLAGVDQAWLTGSAPGSAEKLKDGVPQRQLAVTDLGGWSSDTEKKLSAAGGLYSMWCCLGQWGCRRQAGRHVHRNAP
jgi:hypothetical protein